MRCQAGVAPLVSRIHPALDPPCPPLSPRTPFWFGHKHMGLPARLHPRGSRGWSKTLWLREPAPGHLGQRQPLQHAAAIGVYPPRICPAALPNSISRYNTARPPLPTEHPASCEGKVETPAPLRERRHRRHRTAPRRWEGLTEPRSGVSGWPLPLSRHRPGTAKAASTGSRTKLRTPHPSHGPALLLARPTGDTQSRAARERGSPGTHRERDAVAGQRHRRDPGRGSGAGRDPGSRSRRAATGPARRRDDGDRDTRATPPGTRQPPLRPVKRVCTAESLASTRRDGTAVPGAAAR